MKCKEEKMKLTQVPAIQVGCQRKEKQIFKKEQKVVLDKARAEMRANNEQRKM